MNSPENYDTFNLEQGQDDIIKTEKIITTLTTSENQKNNLDSDQVNIDLGECENTLKQSYNLSNDDVLYIKILEIF